MKTAQVHPFKVKRLSATSFAIYGYAPGSVSALALGSNIILLNL